MILEINVIDLATRFAEIDLDLELMKLVEEKRQLLQQVLDSKNVTNENYYKLVSEAIKNFSVETELSMLKFKDNSGENEEYSLTAQQLFNEYYDYYFGIITDAAVNGEVDKDVSTES